MTTAWIGHGALWLGVAAASAAVVLAIVVTLQMGKAPGDGAGSGENRRGSLRQEGHRGIAALKFLVLLAFLAATAAAGTLLFALLSDDFRLAYVARHSYRLLAPAYKVAAWWSGQEGSLLFWLWILTGYGALLAWRSRREMGNLLPPSLGILAGVEIFFFLLLLLVAPPFETLPAAPPDGRGLNPLLQSYWMVSHPVLLYLGYVGMAVPFAVAMGALIVRRGGSDWIRLTRRWTLTAWGFLSMGILVGARWAYEELGWGGYWGWDPVENASFMPWLTATAFLHSVMVQERRGSLKRWNMALIVLTFFLTIFGTFVTRSGILSSVHTFVESDIGPWFIVFLGVILSGSLYLMVERRDMLRDEEVIESYVSREFGFLVNNLLFLGLAFAVFWGTVFPLAARLMGVEVTVAAPYFNRITVPLFLAMLFLMGIGPLLAWRVSTWRLLKNHLTLPLVNAGLFAVLAYALGITSWGFILTLAGAALVVSAITLEFVQAVGARLRFTGDPWWWVVPGLVFRHPRRWGGYLVHVAVLLIALGIAGHQYYHTEQMASFQVGDSLRAGPYQLIFEGLEEGERGGIPYVGGRLLVREEGRDIGYLVPRKLYYPGFAETQGPTSEVAIHSTLLGDVYVVLAGWDDFGVRVGFQVFWNPMVSWIWWGGALLVVGTVIALWPRPVRVAAEVERIYESLRELEYDRAMEKVGEADYVRLRKRLLGRAAQLEKVAEEQAAVRAAEADGSLNSELARVSPRMGSGGEGRS